MDGAADATAAALGAWASVRGFFTPATLFLVVNLVIGTIALTSRSHQRRRRGYTAHDDAQHHEQQQQQQQQQPPMFEFDHVQQQDDHQYYHDDQQQQRHEQQQQYVPPPAPLARTSSVLDRLRSIGLYRFRSGDFPPEYAAGIDVTANPAPADGDAHHARSRSEPAPARALKKRPAASRSARKPSSSSHARFRAEVAPAPAARLFQAAVLEEQEDGFVDEEEYARNDELRDNNKEFISQQQTPPPVVQHKEHVQEEQYYREEYLPPLRPAPLARAPSVLERLRSFVLPGAAPLEEEYARADELTDDTNFITQQQQQTPPPASQREVEEEQYYREEYVPPLRPAPLARTPSVLERLRSFGLSRFRSGDLDAAAAVAELERNQAQKQQQYSRSRSEPSREQGKEPATAAEAKMGKSSSVARKKPAQEETLAVAEEGGVDARADDFINSFRKQLQLQRLNSLLNYKDMLNRGA